jgi:hypothetical protein
VFVLGTGLLAARANPDPALVLRNWGPAKLASLADWRQHVVTLPYSEQVAVRWGELQARAERRGRPRPPLTSRTSATSLTTTACASLASTNADRRRHRGARRTALPACGNYARGSGSIPSAAGINVLTTDPWFPVALARGRTGPSRKNTALATQLISQAPARAHWSASSWGARSSQHAAG